MTNHYLGAVSDKTINSIIYSMYVSGPLITPLRKTSVVMMDGLSRTSNTRRIYVHDTSETVVIDGK